MGLAMDTCRSTEAILGEVNVSSDDHLTEEEAEEMVLTAWSGAKHLPCVASVQPTVGPMLAGVTTGPWPAVISRHGPRFSRAERRELGLKWRHLAAQRIPSEPL